ncbi:MAG TPA: cell envelope integrity protein CreD [Nevskiales bacterium]|nr:cell envelope integrity protein CreD [Nevskiales bacterium]
MSTGNTTQSRLDWNAPFSRIVLIGLLILLLQIPIMKISGVIHERSTSRAAAAADIAGKWGKEQTLVGPYLALGYRCKWAETAPNGKAVAREQQVTASLLPKDLTIDGTVRSSIRRRGIFEIPVYESDLLLKGRFNRVALDGCPTKAREILLERANLVLHLSDPRALSGSLPLRWNKDTLSFMPGAEGGGSRLGAGVHADIRSHLNADSYSFEIPIHFNGSNRLSFAPFAEHTEVSLRSDWPHPSFQGSWLPREHSIAEDGFTAIWSVSHLGRNYPQHMPTLEPYTEQIQDSHFGVYFMSPVDSHSVTHRIVKYELMVIGLVFATLWMFELLARLRVHPVQYLLVGSAMCLFYLLQLSLAEHLGLLLAYLIASSAVIGLVTAYCLSVLRSALRASVIGSVLALLYGYLYVLLQLEDYALLAGAIGLFAALAMVMYLTRKIDWYTAYRQDTAYRPEHSAPAH